MTRVFISYSRKDKAIAAYLAAELRNRGAEVFIDYQRLIAGENFIGRLGRELEQSSHVLLLLSPHSVGSKWVQAEIAWAMNCNRPIVPVLLDPATSLVDFFFLIAVEQIDFTRWSLDGNVSEGIRKLASALSLPLDPIRNSGLTPIQVEDTTAEDSPREPEPPTAFNIHDIAELFITAADIADSDPEQAVFLYRRVIEIAPNYMEGQAQRFVAQEEARLKPRRLENMLVQARESIQTGQWKRAERIGQDILALEPEQPEAQQLVVLAQHNKQCEPFYQQAQTALNSGKKNAFKKFMITIRTNCPQYGDPAGIVTPISAENIEQLKEVAMLRGHTDVVWGLAWSPFSNFLVSIGLDRSIHVWNPDTYELMHKFTYKRQARSVAVTPDANDIVTVTEDGAVARWNLESQQEAFIRQAPQNITTFFTPYHIDISADGKFLAVPETRTIALIQLASGEVTKLQSHENSIWDVRFSPDGKLLASASADKTIKLWSVAERFCLSTLQEHTDQVWSVSISSNGRLLASGSDDSTVKVWRIGERQSIITLSLPKKAGIRSVCFSPNTHLLAACDTAGFIHLWDVVQDYEMVSSFKAHGSNVNCLAFSPDGRLLASSSDDMTVNLWGVE